MIRNFLRVCGLLLLALCLVLPLGASDSPSGWVPLWLGDGSRLDSAALEQVVREVQQQEAHPQHLVVLVHGYHTTREESNEQFQEVATRVLQSYRNRGLKVAIVGLQWESALASAGVPWEAEEVYLSAVARARQVGHQPARQVLLRLQKAFPKAHINLLAHSLGCEIAAACLLPEMAYGDDLEKSQAFEPRQDIFFNSVALCGSDLDYDVWYKSQVNFRSKQARTHLLWMTVSPYQGARDKTLQVRQMSRGMAGGSAMPRMTMQQCDVVFKNRTVVFDNEDIPTDHALVEYFSASRVERLTQAAHSLVDRKAPKPPEFEEAEKILALPHRVEVLAPWLDSPRLSSQMYALWRLEHLLCGSCVHMTDETMENTARLLRNKPSVVRRERGNSPCKVISTGLWPTEAQLTRAGSPNWD